MDLDDSFVNSLKIEGYDISCVQCNAQNQSFPKGKHLMLYYASQCIPPSPIDARDVHVAKKMLITYLPTIPVVSELSQKIGAFRFSEGNKHFCGEQSRRSCI